MIMYPVVNVALYIDGFEKNTAEKYFFFSVRVWFGLLFVMMTRTLRVFFFP